MPKDRNAIVEQLRRRAAALPGRPGVYLFKDLAGQVLYVGKAKNLRTRVAGRNSGQRVFLLVAPGQLRMDRGILQAVRADLHELSDVAADAEAVE